MLVLIHRNLDVLNLHFCNIGRKRLKETEKLLLASRRLRRSHLSADWKTARLTFINEIFWNKPVSWKNILVVSNHTQMHPELINIVVFCCSNYGLHSQTSLRQLSKLNYNVQMQSSNMMQP